MNLMRALRELWFGRLPLAVAFWRFAIGYGLVVNILATGATLVLILREAPIALAVFFHLLPIPFSVVAATGVWRSADRYSGPHINAAAAKASVVVWCCLWVLL